jgi:hypothetical protein
MLLLIKLEKDSSSSFFGINFAYLSFNCTNNFELLWSICVQRFVENVTT